MAALGSMSMAKPQNAAGQYLGHAFETAAQPPEPGQPSEAALHEPAPRQQYKALLRLRQLDHMQFDVVLRRIAALGLLARVTLVCLGQLDLLACGLLHLSA
jgi:hypothetical protein